MKVTNFLTEGLLEYQVSDPREQIERYPDHVAFAAGGFAATTHYARAKLSYVYPVGRVIVMRARVALPVNFYEAHRASFKLMTFGTEAPYQRAGLWIDSGGYPRLQAEIKGQLLRTLWKGTRRLTTGISLIRLLVVPSAIEGQALTRLSVNGVKWGESTAPNMLDPDHTQVNRFVWGIDGAADQDEGSRLMLSISELELR